MKKKLISPEIRAKSLEFIYEKLSACSIRCLFSLAKLLALIVANTRNQLATQCEENIDLCFADLNKAQKKQLKFDNIHHTCCNFFELAQIWHRPIDQVLALITQQDIPDSFHNPDKSKIIVAPHQGSWELLNLWLAQQGQTLSLYKPTRNPHVDRYVIKSRSRNSAELVPIDTAGLRKLLHGLKHQASCMILPDQKPRANKSCVSAPFMGHATDTSLLIKNLARKSDCDIYIAAVTRDLKQGSYSLQIELLDKNKITESDEISAYYLNHSIEQFIRPEISQYQWTYRRFPEQVYHDHKHSQ